MITLSLSTWNDIWRSGQNTEVMFLSPKEGILEILQSKIAVVNPIPTQQKYEELLSLVY